MSRAWQASECDAGSVVVPRPGGLLVAAASVPLGAAVLLAAGLLPAGARVLVGGALAVLGLRVRAEVVSAAGFRVGATTLRAVGIAAIGLGLVLAAGGVTAAVADLALDDPIATRLPGWPDAGPAVLLSVLVVAAGAATAAAGSPRVGAVVAGVAAGLLVPALLRLEALDLGAGTATIAALVVAAGATAEGLRRGVRDDVGRGLLVAAGVLLVAGRGEAGQLLSSLVGPAGAVSLPDPGSPAGRGAEAAVGAALAVPLLVRAIVARDPAVGLLPLGVLLLSPTVERTTEGALLMLVPAVAVVALGLALVGRGPLHARVDRPVLWAALAVAVLLLLDAAPSALQDAPDPAGAGQGVGVVALVAGLAMVPVVLAVALRARVTPGPDGVAFAVVAALALVAVNPFEQLQGAIADWYLSIPATAVAWLLATAVAGAVAAACRAPLAVAGVVLVGVTGLVRVGMVVAFRAGDPDSGAYAVGLVASQVAPGALVAVVAGAVALVGPDRLVARAQAAAVAALYVGGVWAADGARVLHEFRGVATDDDDPAALLVGAPLLAAVAMLLVLAAGAALLAASTARRPSPVATIAALGGAVVTAVLAAGVGAGAVVPPASAGDPADPLAGSAPPTAAGLVLGLRTLSRVGQTAGAGWPVVLGVLGAGLLVAAWWLESRRPTPPGAPL